MILINSQYNPELDESKLNTGQEYRKYPVFLDVIRRTSEPDAIIIEQMFIKPKHSTIDKTKYPRPNQWRHFESLDKNSIEIAEKTNVKVTWNHNRVRVYGYDCYHIRRFLDAIDQFYKNQ